MLLQPHWGDEEGALRPCEGLSTFFGASGALFPCSPCFPAPPSPPHQPALLVGFVIGMVQVVLVVVQVLEGGCLSGKDYYC